MPYRAPSAMLLRACSGGIRQTKIASAAESTSATRDAVHARTRATPSKANRTPSGSVATTAERTRDPKTGSGI